LPLFNLAPQPGVYKYIRFREQLFYGDFDTSHRNIAIKEGILKQIMHSLLSNSQDVGAGVFVVQSEQVQVSTSGSTTLAVPPDGPGSADDLKIFTEKSTPYGFKVSKL
jgi:hypothetical protein